MVPHVVFVVDLAVEQLHADRHAVLLRRPGYPLEPGDAVGRSFLVAPPLPVAEHRNDVGHSRRRRERDGALELVHQHVVLGRIIEAGAQEIAALSWVTHRADQPGVFHHRPFLGLQQVDRGEPDSLCFAGEPRQRNLAVGPVGHRLLEPAGNGRRTNRQTG